MTSAPRSSSGDGSASGPRPLPIEARGWGWRHAGRSAFAVRDVSFRIEPGERVLLLGASGAGKSTLVAALAGVLGDDDGGEEYGELRVGGRSTRDARGTVGLLLQDPDSQVVLARVGDDVAFGCENLGVPREEIWRRVRASVDAVGLALPLDHPTSELSGGQKQRLALAGVLAMQPGVLLLDEPTANLDPDGVREVRDSVERVLDRSGSTFLVIEHRVDVWVDLVTRVIVLDPAGGLLADGTPEEVLSRTGGTLAAEGVWVPGFPPALPGRSRHPEAVSLLATDALAIARSPGRVLHSGIDVSVSSGRALVLTGPNGSGKSTLGLTIGGLLAPAAGRVRAEALARGLTSEPFRWKSRDLVTRIGSVFQDPEHQFIAGTVRDELAVGLRVTRASPKEIEPRIHAIAERLRLDGLLGANPFTLSGGEKRRLSVATALITRPPLLVLDEPTFGQDSRTWSEMVALLAGLLDEGSAVVAITHDAAFVEAIADSEFVLAASPVSR